MFTDKDFTRFVALCGMMTSDHDGEIVTAARMATAILRERKVTWAELLNGKVTITREQAAPPPPPPPPEPKFKEHQEMARIILDSGIWLGGRERTFVEQMLDWNRPTAKQMDWLHSIYEKVPT